MNRAGHVRPFVAISCCTLQPLAFLHHTNSCYTNHIYTLTLAIILLAPN